MAQYHDKGELLKLGEIDPEVDEFIKTHGSFSMDTGNIEVFCAAVESARPQAQAALADVPPTIKSSAVSYQTRDGASVDCRLVQPATPPATGSPLIIVIHGGGFSSGFAEMGELPARGLTQTFGAVCVAISHRLAPKHPFPGPVEDIWDAVLWARDNASNWGADPALGFLLTGTSSGANLATAATLMSRREGLSPPISGLLLNIPHLIPIDAPPEHLRPWYLAWEQNKDAPIINRGACTMFMESYNAVPDDWRYTPYAYPGGLKQLDLPKTVVQVAGMDPLRDDGLLYERTLREDLGVQTKLYVYPGVPHGHGSTWPSLTASQQEHRDFVEGVGWLLGRIPGQ